MVGASAVKLHLPPEWRRIHDVLNVSLTKPLLSDPAKPHRAVTPPPPVQWLDGEPLYRVECLLEHMVAKRGRKNTVKKPRVINAFLSFINAFLNSRALHANNG